jgi:Fcf2 pre-rRNA processing
VILITIGNFLAVRRHSGQSILFQTLPTLVHKVLVHSVIMVGVITRNRARSLSSASSPHPSQDGGLVDDPGGDRASLGAADDELEIERKDATTEPCVGVGSLLRRAAAGGMSEDDEDDESRREDDDSIISRDETAPNDEEEREEGNDQLISDRTGTVDVVAKDYSQEGGMQDGGESATNKSSEAASAPRAIRKNTAKAKRIRGKTKNDMQGNPLTKLIPGYTAPMQLNTSSLDKFRPSGGIRELQRRAERTDASTKDFVVGSTAKHAAAMRKTPQGFLPKSYTDAYASFKKGIKRPPDTSAGKGWFGMTPTPMTDELKTDLAVIRNRTYLDPKRFYKSADKHHKIVQVGTVIEGPSEFFSSRLTKKQRRSNITEEIMADPSYRDYAQNKFKQMSREKTQQAQMRKVKPKRSKKFY